MLSPLNGRGGRSTAPEPELLTHREFEDEGYDYDDPDSQYDEPVQTDEEARRKRRKKIWRRIRRTSYVFLALMIVVPLVGFFIAYQVVEVPNPEALAQQLDKTVTVEWANGEQFTTIAPEGRRTLVKYDEIPKPVLHAVFAAEDNTFETNDGFDISGILRAVWNNISGGQGGGSTITQQYVKKATENEEKTLTRKALELVTAYKMSNTMDKNDIITAYLNTIYFGRKAYGIKAAAKAYYNKDLKEITPEEAATLAGVIQQPTRGGNDPEFVQKRWNYVMDKLVENNWYPADKRATAQFPELAANEAGNAQMTPDMRLIWEQAKLELDAAGIKEDAIGKNGYKIKLTVDKANQDLAKAAIESVMAGQPQNLRQALVAVDPATGRILASYGYNQAKNGIDYARAWMNPGSAFKPFDLVALLHKGKGLGETYNGTSPQYFGKDCARKNNKGCVPMSNSENSDACGEQCSVARAMELSINTVFGHIAYEEVGTRAVAKAAIEAGIPANIGSDKRPLEGTGDAPPDLNISIGGGSYVARPIDMAGAYATFAANGTKRKPHIVAQVTDPNNGNQVVYDGDQQPASAGTAAFDRDPTMNAKIARNVTESLIPVVANNKNLKCAEGRECAGKTGTHGCPETKNTKKSDNCAAWMVGYTPQIATSVWVGADQTEAIVNKGKRPIFGGGLPGEIWKKFMDSYLKGKEKLDFGNYSPIGRSPDQAITTTSNSQPRGNDNSNGNNQTSSQTSSPTQTSAPTTSKTTTSSTRPTLTIPGGGNPGGGGPGGGGPGGGGRNDQNDFSSGG